MFRRLVVVGATSSEGWLMAAMCCTSWWTGRRRRNSATSRGTPTDSACRCMPVRIAEGYAGRDEFLHLIAQNEVSIVTNASICVFVCLSLCPRAYLRNSPVHIPILHRCVEYTLAERYQTDRRCTEKSHKVGPWSDDLLWRNFPSTQCRNCSRDTDHAHLGNSSLITRLKLRMADPCTKFEVSSVSCCGDFT